MKEKWDLSKIDSKLFDDDPTEISEPRPNHMPSYKVLIADDDDDVHKVTRLMLQGFTFEGKTLDLLHSYTGQETLEVCRENPDIAILFLDVVMESNHSGLEVVRFLREEEKNNLIRIILRALKETLSPFLPA